MGFFDFLNPKKKIENKLVAAAQANVLKRAAGLRGVGEDELRSQLKGIVTDELCARAGEVIPPAMQSVSDKLIEEASDTMCDQLYDKVRAQLTA